MGSLRRFLGVYYAYVFLFDFMLAYAIYTALFALEGISVGEIGVLLAFWSASAIVLEMPSGALSDHFDRRALLIAAPLTADESSPELPAASSAALAGEDRCRRPVHALPAATSNGGARGNLPTTKLPCDS